MTRDENRAGYQEPEHRQHAEAFMSFVRGDVVERFPAVRFNITNTTEEDVLGAPGMIQAAKLEGWGADANQIAHDADEADKRSAMETMIQIGMYSDSQVEIEEAAKLLARRAAQLRGRVDGDAGVIESRIGKALDKILGHRPEHEDVARLMRLIGYKFT